MLSIPRQNYYISSMSPFYYRKKVIIKMEIIATLFFMSVPLRNTHISGKIKLSEIKCKPTSL